LPGKNQDPHDNKNTRKYLGQAQTVEKWWTDPEKLHYKTVGTVQNDKPGKDCPGKGPGIFNTLKDEEY